jgi:hypothetical protein
MVLVMFSSILANTLLLDDLISFSNQECTNLSIIIQKPDFVEDY